MTGNRKGLVVINTISLLFMLFFNYASGTGILTGATVGEVSRIYDTLFAPSDYAFSIWGLIFLLCIIFVAHQWVLLKTGDPANYIGRTGIWFFISNISNALWLYCWTNHWIGASVVLILLLLISLCVLAVRLRLELEDEPVRTILFVWWPVTFYLGWILVATIACIASWFVYLGWSGGSVGEVTCTILMIVIALGLYLLLIKRRNLREAAIVGIWAFIAIGVRQLENELAIAMTALFASAILLIYIALHGYNNRQYSLVEKIKRNEWK